MNGIEHLFGPSRGNRTSCGEPTDRRPRERPKRPQDIAQDIPQDIAQDIAEHIAQDIAKDITQAIGEDLSQDLRPDISRDDRTCGRARPSPPHDQEDEPLR